MATQTHSPFETLARVIEHLDDDGRSVRRTEATGSGGDGSLRATVDVSVGIASGVDAGLEPTDATVDDGLSVTFRAPAFPDPAAALPPEHPQVSAVPADVWLDGDSIVVTLEVAIGDADRSDDGAGAASTALPSATAGGSGPTDAAGTPATATVEGGSAGTDAGGTDGRREAATVDAGRGAEADEASADDLHEAGADDPDGKSTSPLAAVRDESVPPYDDTPYLRRLYETCGTFAEMSERIEMDVSAETVRRYMIEADVHSPASYETADGTPTSSRGAAGDTADGAETASEAAAETTTDTGRAEQPTGTAGRGESTADDDSETAASLPDEQLVADGIGLPEALTLHDVVDAVVDARTVHEVQREIGLGYDRTRQLLVQLNVLDLVVGRVAGEPDRTVTVDVVADRIRECTPDAA